MGPFNIQVSEVAKLVLILALARWLSGAGSSLGWRRLGASFVLLVPPVYLVYREPDLGTTLSLANLAVAGSADDLYRAVWGGVYHPLRHRNTLYVSLNRTRKLVSERLGEREVVHRDGTGWTLAPGVDLAIVRRDPRVVSSVTAPMRR